MTDDYWRTRSHPPVRCKLSGMRKPSIGRRRFLKQAAVTGAAVVVAGGTSEAAPQQVPGLVPSAPPGLPALPRESDPSPAVEVLTTDRPGGDLMVDVLKT